MSAEKANTTEFVGPKFKLQVSGIFLEEIPCQLVQILVDYSLTHLVQILVLLRKKFSDNKSPEFWRTYFKCLDSVFSWRPCVKRSEVVQLQKRFPMLISFYEFTYLRMAQEFIKAYRSTTDAQTIKSIPSMQDYLQTFMRLLIVDPTVRDLRFLNMAEDKRFFMVSRLVRESLRDCVQNVGIKAPRQSFMTGEGNLPVNEDMLNKIDSQFEVHLAVVENKIPEKPDVLPIPQIKLADQVVQFPLPVQAYGEIKQPAPAVQPSIIQHSPTKFVPPPAPIEKKAQFGSLAVFPSSAPRYNSVIDIDPTPQEKPKQRSYSPSQSTSSRSSYSYSSSVPSSHAEHRRHKKHRPKKESASIMPIPEAHSSLPRTSYPPAFSSSRRFSQ
jgi:hypothetical protein